MLNKISSTIFNAVGIVVATGALVWLAVTGHAWQVEGLLLVMGAILGAVIFGFRLSEGAETHHPSLWAGPLGSLRRKTAKASSAPLRPTA